LITWSSVTNKKTKTTTTKKHTAVKIRIVPGKKKKKKKRGKKSRATGKNGTDPGHKRPRAELLEETCTAERFGLSRDLF